MKGAGVLVLLLALVTGAPGAAARSLLFDLQRADLDVADAPHLAAVALQDSPERLALTLRAPFTLRFRDVDVVAGGRLRFAVGRAEPRTPSPAQLVARVLVKGEATATWSTQLDPASTGWSPQSIDLGCAAAARVDIVIEASLPEPGNVVVALSDLEVDATPVDDTVVREVVADLRRTARLPALSGEAASSTVDVPADAELEIEAERDGQAPGDLTVQIAIDREIATFVLPAERAVVARHLSLAGHAGSNVRIAARLAGSDPGLNLRWWRFQVVARRTRPAPPPGGDLLLLLVDTLRADRLGAYGNDWASSSHLDRLSRRSRLFQRVVSQAPWTTPSVSALMSGQYPHEAADPSGWGQHAAPRVLAEAFAATGRHAVGISANPLVGPRGGFERGFDTFLVADFARARSVVDLFRSWLSARSSHPLFAYLHFMDPHHPYAPPAPMVGLLPGGAPATDARDPAVIAAAYDAEIASWDAELGSLLASLRRRGSLERSVIAVTGDHGEEIGEHGLYGHGKQLHEESVHVPLVVRAPDIPAGSLVHTPLELRRAGGILARTMGTSWWGAPEEGPALSEVTRFPGAPGGSRAISDGTFKLLVAGATGRLFDLEADPAERHDVSARHPAIVRRMREELDALIPAPASDAEPPLDPALMEQLRALGYVGP